MWLCSLIALALNLHSTSIYPSFIYLLQLAHCTRFWYMDAGLSRTHSMRFFTRLDVHFILIRNKLLGSYISLPQIQRATAHAFIFARIQREDTGHGNDYCQCEIQELEHGHVSIFPGSLAECFFLFVHPFFDVKDMPTQYNPAFGLSTTRCLHSAL